MRLLALALALAAAAALPAAVAAQQHPAKSAPEHAPAAARAELKDAKGAKVGTATFTTADDGVAMAVQVQGLPPGEHGLHVHAAGKCDDPEFKSAGGHFNPGNKKHGHDNPEGPHAGDLPNLKVGPDGKGEAQGKLVGATLGEGPASLLGPQGTALVVHAGPDDGKTDPAGNSGARIACGVVARGK
jgi:Cu-Zn family superoxide dismutase